MEPLMTLVDIFERRYRIYEKVQVSLSCVSYCKQGSYTGATVKFGRKMHKEWQKGAFQGQKQSNSLIEWWFSEKAL